MIEADSVQGEMPWQELGALEEGKDTDCYRRDAYGWWKCVECGHRPDDHYDPYSYECSECNCGNRTRF